MRRWPSTCPHAQRLSGALGDDALQGVQLVLKSPGLAPTDERIAALIHTARQTGVPVQGELDLFARALADLKDARGYAPKVIAITGTNGKTTTTSMTAQLIERADKRVAVAGNIGPTMLQTLADVLAAEPRAEVGARGARDRATRRRCPMTRWLLRPKTWRAELIEPQDATEAEPLSRRSPLPAAKRPPWTTTPPPAAARRRT